MDGMRLPWGPQTLKIVAPHAFQGPSPPWVQAPKRLTMFSCWPRWLMIFSSDMRASFSSACAVAGRWGHRERAGHGGPHTGDTGAKQGAPRAPKVIRCRKRQNKCPTAVLRQEAGSSGRWPPHNPRQAFPSADGPNETVFGDGTFREVIKVK